MSALSIEGVSVNLSGARILADVSVEVAPGTVHAVIGPNGAGKTTLVNAVTGLVPATSGQMRVGGTTYSPRRPHRAARLGVSRTFQHPVTFRTLSAVQHAQTGASGNGEGRTNPGCTDLLASLLEEIGPGQAAQFGLMKVRLTDVARALASIPTVLLMDEPASGLDESDRARMLALIRAIKGVGIGVLLIEHDIQLVRSVADVVTVLDDGEVVFNGSATSVLDDPAVSRAYLGR